MRPGYCHQCGVECTDLDDPFYFSGASFVVQCESCFEKSLTPRQLRKRRIKKMLASPSGKAPVS
jgi:hypothetical protein